MIDSNLITAKRREQNANNHASPRMMKMSKLDGIMDEFNDDLLLTPAIESRDDDTLPG